MSIFDKVFILSLQDHDISPLLTHLKEIGLIKNEQEDIYRYSVKGSTEIPNQGNINDSLWNIMSHSTINATSRDITMNHINMIRTAHDLNLSMVLFLEEDCFFPNGKSSIMRLSDEIQYLKKHLSSWDIFYLGYCPWPILWNTFISSSIVKLSSSLAAHSYVLHFHSMEKILQQFFNNSIYNDMHIDAIFSKLPQFRKYGQFPMTAFQNKEPALYLKACDHIGLYMSFNTTCRLFEWLSVLLPIIIICILFIIVYYFIIRIRHI